MPPMLIRAGASNREMVGALGSISSFLYTPVFGLGAALAGFAGVPQPRRLEQFDRSRVRHRYGAGALRLKSPAPGFAEKYWSLSGFPSHSLESGGGAFFTVIFGQIFAYFAFCDSHSSSPGSVSGFIASDRREVREIPHLCHRGHAAPCATVTDFDSIFRSELTEAASVTAIRALRMQKDQLQAGHTIPPSHSGRQASERPPCCHKESLAAYL
jgi:hypothetical protein